MLVGRIEKNKQTNKQKQKNHKKSRNRRPCYPRMTWKVNIYIFGLTKCTQYTVKNFSVFVPVFLYTITMLIFQIKRIISSEKWFNFGVTSFSFFFWKCQTFWVGRTTLNVEPFIFLFALSIFPFLFLRCVIFGLFGRKKTCFLALLLHSNGSKFRWVLFQKSG